MERYDDDFIEPNNIKGRRYLINDSRTIVINPRPNPPPPRPKRDGPKPPPDKPDKEKEKK